MKNVGTGRFAHDPLREKEETGIVTLPLRKILK